MREITEVHSIHGFRRYDTADLKARNQLHYSNISWATGPEFEAQPLQVQLSHNYNQIKP